MGHGSALGPVRFSTADKLLPTACQVESRSGRAGMPCELLTCTSYAGGVFGPSANVILRLCCITGKLYL